MTPEHLTVLRALLDDKTPAPLTYNEAVLVEYVKMLADRAMEFLEISDSAVVEKEGAPLFDALEKGGF